MKIAFISPFSNTTNRYIDLQKQLLKECGFVAKPLSIKALLTGQAWGIFKRDNVIAFHWLETRPFIWRDAHARLALKGSIEFIFYLLLIIAARAKVIYFVHDHAVHDTVGWRHKLSVQLIRLLQSLADTRIVHDPSFSTTYRATYLPHPLYWDDGDLQAPTTAPAVAVPKRSSETPLYGMLGAVRPYKNIHAILEIWPQGTPLIIRGRATDQYATKLRDIISRRNLAPQVNFQPGYMSDADFAASLAEVDVLILAHISDSMLVSGAFFEAIGQVPVIWARESPFIRWIAQQLPNVMPFKSDQELVNRVLAQDIPPAIADPGTQDKKQAAVALFGWAECVRAYSAMLQA